MKIKPREVNWNFHFILSSGDEEYPGCKLNISFYKWDITLNLPPITKPGVCKIRGKYNYDELIESRYGVYLFENHFNIMYGRGDANFHRDIFGEEQRWSCFLPWTEQRMVRHTIEPEKIVFIIQDFDGEEIKAETHFEEREFRKGAGLFKFFSFFTKPKLYRTLEIWFDKETGKRKGSWKGGTLGCGVESVKGESHLVAFTRYCQNNNMVLKETVEL